MILTDLISLIEGDNARRCLKIWRDNPTLFAQAQGSTHNHQAWPGGYLDHVRAVMNCACTLYPSMLGLGPLPFSLSDALLVLFLHDLEKPWKKNFPKGCGKAFRATFRRHLLIDQGIALTSEQQNALSYVEGEGEDYRSDRRVMNELAAFCHMCDVASARIWWGR